MGSENERPSVRVAEARVRHQAEDLYAWLREERPKPQAEGQPSLRHPSRRNAGPRPPHAAYCPANDRLAPLSTLSLRLAPPMVSE